MLCTKTDIDMSVLNIISLNVNGLGDSDKRRTINNFYRDKCDILCLQETHSEENTAGIWENEWGGKIYFSHGTSNSRGTSVMFKRGFKGDILDHYTDNDGRFVCCKVLFEGMTVCIASLYGPNKDSPMFFDKVLNSAFLMCDK